jgi:hypothetical protein
MLRYKTEEELKEEFGDEWRSKLYTPPFNFLYLLGQPLSKYSRRSLVHDCVKYRCILPSYQLEKWKVFRFKNNNRHNGLRWCIDKRFVKEV